MPQPPRYRAPERWTAGRVVAVVAGAVLLLAATGPLIGGAALAWADTSQRDDGYVWSVTDDLQTWLLVAALAVAAWAVVALDKRVRRGTAW